MVQKQFEDNLKQLEITQKNALEAHEQSQTAEKVCFLNKNVSVPFCKFLYDSCTLRLESRLRVVPHFLSGIVERAKRERAWKSPHARKARRSRLFSHGVIFTRARVSLSLLSLRTYGGLLVVQLESKWHTTFRVVSVKNVRQQQERLKKQSCPPGRNVTNGNSGTISSKLF